MQDQLQECIDAMFERKVSEAELEICLQRFIAILSFYYYNQLYLYVIANQ